MWDSKLKMAARRHSSFGSLECVACEMDAPDCRSPQHKHFNDNDAANNLVMRLIDSRGQNRARAEARPHTEPINWFIISVLVSLSMITPHTLTDKYVYVSGSVCITAACGSSTANAIRLLICQCSCAPSATKMAATVTTNCDTVNCGILPPNVLLSDIRRPLCYVRAQVELIYKWNHTA